MRVLKWVSQAMQWGKDSNLLYGHYCLNILSLLGHSWFWMRTKYMYRAYNLCWDSCSADQVNDRNASLIKDQLILYPGQASAKPKCFFLTIIPIIIPNTYVLSHVHGFTQYLNPFLCSIILVISLWLDIHEVNHDLHDKASLWGIQAFVIALKYNRCMLSWPAQIMALYYNYNNEVL